MDESSVAVLERPVAFYQVSQRELAFRSNEVTKIAEMQGTRRTQYVEIKGAGPGIFKVQEKMQSNKKNTISQPW